ncbi:hypothetical protein FRY74_00235 [Vicingus serpentipes]|uniref:Uncharacterized protein n=1 Tax=Vicingus serpentipes TaxID=1926625 RepID=A0A5C6RXC9_9FLAO|nr:hypothetical protein [Vicingus serpentipes]TXB66645.1 hypothetical protein FRY74_00235 [Vicingus serpentipes]
MKRKRISRDLSFHKYTILFCIISTLMTLLAFYLLGAYNLITGTAIVLLFFIVFFLFFSINKVVEYDNNNMYILKEDKTEVIPLKNILKIKMTMTTLNHSIFWKITYLNESNTTKNIRILPRIWYQNFFSFREEVKKANKNVIIKNYSHSFDFDQ